MNRAASLLLASLLAVACVASSVACGDDPGAAADASASDAPTSDGGPTNTDAAPADDAGDDAPTDPGPYAGCGGGTLGIVWFEVRAGESGGALTGFADCIDAGALPPVAKEGECTLLYPEGAFDPALAGRSHVAHGVARATQVASGVAVTLASDAHSASYTGAVTAGAPFVFELDGAPGVPKGRAEVATAARVTATVPATIARTGALVVPFTGGVAGDLVRLRLRSGLGVDGGRVLDCSVDAAKGAVTVPAAIVAGLPAGEHALEMSTVSRGAKIGLAQLVVRVAAAGAPASVTLQ